MEFVKTENSDYGRDILANYNYVTGERHVRGVDVPASVPHVQIYREHTYCAWRGTGTSASFSTSIITETFKQEGRTDKIAVVNLMVDIDHKMISVAMNSGEARKLAETLRYLADVADKIEGGY